MVDRVQSRIPARRLAAVCQLGRRKLYCPRRRTHRTTDDASRDLERRELLPRDAVKKTLTYAGMPKPQRSSTDPAPASGLAWYVNSDGVWKEVPRDAFAGAGAGHQVIVVIPSLDLVVVRNGEALADPKTGFWGPVYEENLRSLMAG